MHFNHSYPFNRNSANLNATGWLLFIFAPLMLLTHSQSDSILLSESCDDSKIPKILYNAKDQLLERPLPYSEFHSKYNKPYVKGAADYNIHCLNYYKQVEQLVQLALTVSWKVGTNHLSDSTSQQKQRMKDLLSVNERQILKNNIQETRTSPEKLKVPPSLNWVELGKVSSVKDQGGCGSCWSFATCAYGQSKALILSGIDRNKDLSQQSIYPQFLQRVSRFQDLISSTLKSEHPQRFKEDVSSLVYNLDLSQEYLLSCTPESTCNGGYLEYVFQTAAGGIPLESTYPYTGNKATNPLICFSNSKMMIGHQHKIRYRLTDQTLIQLLQNQPLAISISSEGWLPYKEGVFSCTPTGVIDHAVLLVGYTPDYWIVKNQWGQDWGEKGYIRISRKKHQNCKIGTGVFYMSEKQMELWLGSIILAILLASMM